MRTVKAIPEVFNGKRGTEITPAAVERSKPWRLVSISRHGRHPRPAAVNRELACLKLMFNVVRKGLIGLKGGILSENPVSTVTFVDENNVRYRVLTPEEFQRMVTCSSEYLEPVLLCAYHTGMRRGEILRLTWDRVDLKSGFIRLKETDTKTRESRSIPVGRELCEELRSLPGALATQGHCISYVFTRHRQPIQSIREMFAQVCKEAGITNFVFHDLRHIATTNLRRAGGALTAMKIAGHKTMTVFRRYNTIDGDALLAARRRMDTYTDS